MNTRKLAGLEPASVFGYFEDICAIPHGSGNTKQISDFIVSFAREQGLRYVQDELNNVIIFSEGTSGYEDRAPVILQGHMDMVCDQDSHVAFFQLGNDLLHFINSFRVNSAERFIQQNKSRIGHKSTGNLKTSEKA